jgi:hypothetical protein
LSHPVIFTHYKAGIPEKANVRSIRLCGNHVDVGRHEQKEIIAITPLQVRWFTPPYYTDGRERAQLLGDSSHGGTWVDRVKIPAG